MRNLLAICAFLLLTTVVGQGIIDSLEAQLQKEPVSQRYVDILNELNFQYLLQKPGDALPSINRAIDISDSLGYDIGYFRALTNKGSAYWTSGLPDLALKYYLQANANIIDGNTIPNAALQNNIGEVFKKRGQYDSAIKYYLNGVQEALNGKPRRMPVMLYYNIGETYLIQANIDSASKYFQLAFDSAKANNHTRGLSYSLSGWAELAFMQGDLMSSIMHQKQSLKIRKDIMDQRGIIQSYHHLSTTYRETGRWKVSLAYLDSALMLSKTNKTNDLLSETYDRLAKYYTSKGAFELALNFATKHYQLNDSLSNQVFVENVEQIKSALMGEIQSIENKLLLENQKKLESETQAQLLIIIGIAGLFIMFGIFMYLNIQRRNAIRLTASNRKIIETLQTVSQSGSSRGFHDFMKELLEASAETLQSDRASFWAFDPLDKTIEISDYYSANGKFQTLGTKVSVGFFKNYFDLLHREKLLAVWDTNSSEIAVEYDKEYIRRFGIKSLIDVEIQSEDTFIGILSFEQTSKARKWSYSDQRFASSLSNIIASAYLLNENRKLLVELLQKNGQLRDSGFALSHDLREPLSQILGFTQLMINGEKADYGEIWRYINEASQRMDEVIKRLTTQLITEDTKT